VRNVFAHTMQTLGYVLLTAIAIWAIVSFTP
jgi:hypothetical protein